MEKGTDRASIRLDGALAAHFAVPTRTLAQVCQPGIEIWSINLCYQGYFSLLCQVRLQQSKGCSVPFHGFGAMVATLMIKHVILDSLDERGTRSTIDRQSLALVLSFGSLWLGGFCNLLLVSLGLGIIFDTLN